MLEDPILEVRGVRKTYKKGGLFGKGKVEALKGITFSIKRGESFGIAGESGCGKSTLCRIICGLDREFEGSVTLLGKDIREYGRNLGRKIQIVFQNPYSSLNPLMRVEDIIFEGARIHKLDVKDTVMGMLKRMGFEPEVLKKYPHQLSGGERQRIAMLRALSMEPEVLIADEPLSALDLSTQAEILHLLEEIKEEFNLTLVFVSHDLRVVKEITNRSIVMYKGTVVEEGTSKDIFESPLHPYTRELVASIPASHPGERKKGKIQVFEGPASTENTETPEGICPFLSRCTYKTDICFKEPPKRLRLSGRVLLCHKVPE